MSIKDAAPGALGGRPGSDDRTGSAASVHAPTATAPVITLDADDLELYTASDAAIVDDEAQPATRRKLALRIVRFFAAQQLLDLDLERSELRAILQRVERELGR